VSIVRTDARMTPGRQEVHTMTPAFDGEAGKIANGGLFQDPFTLPDWFECFKCRPSRIPTRYATVETGIIVPNSSSFALPKYFKKR
jgi:hypothetical protein